MYRDLRISPKQATLMGHLLPSLPKPGRPSPTGKVDKAEAGRWLEEPRKACHASASPTSIGPAFITIKRWNNASSPPPTLQLVTLSILRDPIEGMEAEGREVWRAVAKSIDSASTLEQMLAATAAADEGKGRRRHEGVGPCITDDDDAEGDRSREEMWTALVSKSSPALSVHARDSHHRALTGMGSWDGREGKAKERERVQT